MRILLVLIVLVLATACRQNPTPTPESSVQAAQIDLTIDPDPPAVGAGALVVTVTRAGAPLTDAPLSARGDMTHAGMRPVLAEATTDASGGARIPFEWTMGGDWIVTIVVTLPDGSEVSQQFNVSVNS